VNRLIRTISIAIVFTTPALAQKLVDPTTVAPEYREAAEHRRAEQVRQRECSLKADLAKVQVRDRTAFVLKCLEADAGK
jgi:hypothetical protein